jgi:hypothetical protein
MQKKRGKAGLSMMVVLLMLVFLVGTANLGAQLQSFEECARQARAAYRSCLESVAAGMLSGILTGGMSGGPIGALLGAGSGAIGSITCYQRFQGTMMQCESLAHVDTSLF